ncbi:MAG TPA: YbaB/EbfC family nucleoid-associated protein [Fimbriimonadaceae bacterium]|nr:YbaB/EbfC family nucleoid-associated protein [Fimbriimonadaceae bacterium]
MKLPKNFGGHNMGNMMQQMQGAMQRAQTLETELAGERITVDKGLVKATFNGTGEILKLTIDKSIVDPEDVEALEDLVVSAMKDGFNQATAMRAARVQEILPNVPDIPGL